MAFKGNLWHHRDFVRFWTGDTFSQFTGPISALALPTIAILTLKVTPLQLGILSALGLIAFPVLGLFVGVWMDRVRRMPVMIAANVIEAAALASVPAAYLLGVLGLDQLYAVALTMGTCTLFFDVAYQSYLPTLVRKEDVIEGNQKLQTSATAAQVAGPTVASALMGLVGASLSVVADVFGTLAAVFALSSVKQAEPHPAAVSPGQERHFFAEMKEGIRVITGNALLWTQAGCTGTSNLGSNMFYVALFLFAYRLLGVSEGVIGIAFTMGAVGGLTGVLISTAVTRRLGLGHSVALATAGGFGVLLVLLAHGSLAVFIIGGALFVSSLGIPIYNINQVSLRQVITPNRLQGRMNATMRTIIWGTIPVGSFLGGIFCTTLGIVPTLILGGSISGGSFLWIVLGPTFRLRQAPKPATD